MARNTTTGTTGAEAAALSAADAQRLRNTIKGMDAMCQEGFGRIESLANLALMALETPDAYRFPEVIAQVLETIAGIAQTAMCEANSNAEKVGCDHINQTEQRRMDAHRIAREVQA